MNIQSVISKVTGWRFVGDVAEIDKSIVVMAPHTSYWDAIIGKVFLVTEGIEHRFLSARWLFFFPMNIFMRLFGSIPTGGKEGGNAILEICELLDSHERLHVVICPEGGFAPRDKWNPGFYFMAVKANVPIVTAYIDYQKKEVGIKSVITDTADIQKVFQQIVEDYTGVAARHPENFKLPTKNLR